MKHTYFSLRHISQILFGMVLLMILPLISFASEDACIRSYTSGFDGVDKIFSAVTQENLESEKSNKVHAVDSVEIYTSTIQAYQCNLMLICEAVQTAYGYEGEENKEAFEKVQFNLSEYGCGDQISYVEGEGKNLRVVSTEANIGNIIQFFEVQDEFNGCKPTSLQIDQNIDVYHGCRQVAEVKVRMKMAELSSMIKLSASRKRLAYMMAKLNDLHVKMNPLKNTEQRGLVQTTALFVQKLNSVLTLINCTVVNTK